MVNRKTPAGIFVDEREGRARYRDWCADLSNDAFDELRLTGTERPYERDHAPNGQVLSKLATGRFRFGRTIGNAGSHGAIWIFEFRFSNLD